MDEEDLDGEEGGGKRRRRRSPMFELAGGMVVFCIIGVVLVAFGRGFIPSAPPERPHASAMVAGSAKPSSPSLERSVSYRADSRGQYYVDAVVNGAPIHFLIDTGASYVSLTPKDAAVAGLSESDLRFSMPLNTAHGVTHAAPVVLRAIRVEQLELDDVAAVVMDQSMATSVLGMSFLSRLDGYSIRDGVLTIEW